MALKTVSGKHADPRKGRGAGVNPEGRFEKVEREAFDDGWDRQEEDLPPLKTHITEERVKSIISRNDSPDIPFTQSINPYQGCEHGCVYCVAGDTPILMADGRTKPIAEIRAGDEIYGTGRNGWFRQYVKTRVLAHWSVIKPAYRITLEDGTELIAGSDHRFLTERGWKYVTGRMAGRDRRPYLTTGNKLMGTGGFARGVEHGPAYRLGYLCGMIRGDGLLASYYYRRSGRTHGTQHQFRLALCDAEALFRTKEYLLQHGVATHDLVFQRAAGERRAMHAIRNHSLASVERIRIIIEWPCAPCRDWYAGFLAGIFDAEGSYSNGILRIPNTDPDIVFWIREGLDRFGFAYKTENLRPEGRKPMQVIRITGGLREHLRFFHIVEPAISRKLDISGQAVKSGARLQLLNVEPYSKGMRLYDITTETEDFIANGVVSHNCYARPSHAYRNLSPGIDFETRIFAKVNAAEKLREELAKPGYRCEVISLGANTDPYQPAERGLKITRGILEVCAEFNQPVGIVTKNALVERDIDLLAPMARKNLAAVFISCNNLDHDLARRLEPRCSAPARRLEAMKRVSDAGIPVGVLVAPVIPFLTDHQIEPVLEAAWQQGARQAGYILMRLPWEVKDLFREWLERNYPLKAKHVMSRVQAMRGGRDNDPNFGSRMKGEGELAKLLAQRFHIACERLGYNASERYRELDTTLFRAPARSAQLSLFGDP
ncbi:MAG: PA0069 family radical SAM protein [Betaproteobacteria bacterium]|nr:PA0069 family radical SAM protein [Betaproteobacteria bacterium]